MHIMIHACPQRRWYVDEFLVPSLFEQGLPESDVEVYEDTAGRGCLQSTIISFTLCGKREGGTWHLQDDVILARDFVKRAEENDDGLVCGYGNQQFGPYIGMAGNVPVIFHWWSFPCIRIPNHMAREFAEWCHTEAQCREQYRSCFMRNNGDDSLFRDWVVDKYPYIHVTNMKPNLVDHIDYLIGGSTVTNYREHPARAFYFEDRDLVDELADKLATRALNAV